MTKIAMVLLKVVVGAVVLFLAFVGLCAIALPLIFNVSETVIEKVPSHDSKYEALLVQRDGPLCINSTGYSVRVRAMGTEARGNEVLLVDHVDGPKDVLVSWSDDVLVVSLPRGHKAYREDSSTRVGKDRVQVSYTTREQ